MVILSLHITLLAGGCIGKGTLRSQWSTTIPQRFVIKLLNVFWWDSEKDKTNMSFISIFTDNLWRNSHALPVGKDLFLCQFKIEKGASEWLYEAKAWGWAANRSIVDNSSKNGTLLLMEEIMHQLIGRSSHYLQGFIHPRWCRISSINSMDHHIPDIHHPHLWTRWQKKPTRRFHLWLKAFNI